MDTDQGRSVDKAGLMQKREGAKPRQKIGVALTNSSLSVRIMWDLNPPTSYCFSVPPADCRETLPKLRARFLLDMQARVK